MPPRAAALSERLLAPLGRRWRHVEGVARRAGSLSSLASAEERPAVVTAAWLHDVGYAPAIAVTGLHPLDGARYLRSEGWPELVVCLVAHHTGAEVEAEERIRWPSRTPPRQRRQTKNTGAGRGAWPGNHTRNSGSRSSTWSSPGWRTWPRAGG